jgi:hypothetical protein
VARRASGATVDLRAASETNSTPGQEPWVLHLRQILVTFVLPITTPTPAFPIKAVDHNKDIRYEILRRLFSGYGPGEGHL